MPDLQHLSLDEVVAHLQELEDPRSVSGGALPSALQGTTQDAPVQTTQIAVTALNMLGLSADRLQGVVIEGTKGLPGLHVPQNQTVTLTVNENDQVMVGAFNDSSTTDNLNKYKVAVQWGDDQEDQNAILIRDASNPHIVDVWDRHTYDAPGIYDGTVVITPPAGSTTTETSTARVLDVLTGPAGWLRPGQGLEVPRSIEDDRGLSR